MSLSVRSLRDSLVPDRGFPPFFPLLPPPPHPTTFSYGLIKYIDTKAKCRHLKNWPAKGLVFCGRYLSEFVDWRYSQSFWYFRPSWTVAPLTFSLDFPPPPPSFPVWISVLYSRIQCVRGGYGVLGLWEDKHLSQSPFTGQFFRWRHFALPSMSLIFLHLSTLRSLCATGYALTRVQCNFFP